MPDTCTHFVFVDFENAPEVDLSGIREQPVHVTLMLGNKQKKLDLELVKQIKAFTVQVELVEVGGSGRNALDLTLACYLGRAIERAHAATFAIVSKDKDFAPMIAHLTAQKIAIARFDNFASLPFLTHRKPVVAPKIAATPKAVPPTKKPPEDRRTKVIAALKNPLSKNRPADQTALRAHIRNALGKEASDEKVDSIVGELIAAGSLTIDPRGKVSYRVAN
ncbi:MAG: PIN domain-containing protein [Opitutus sp.]